VYVILIGITALEMAEGKPPYGDIHPMRVCIVLLSVMLFMYLSGNCRWLVEKNEIAAYVIKHCIIFCLSWLS